MVNYNNSVKDVPMQPASMDIWDKKYRLKDKNGVAIDESIDDTYKRVALALSDVEKTDELRDYWNEQFLWAMRNGAIPAGRILSNAGAEKYKPSTSLINCLVSGNIVDSMDDILTKLHESGLSLKGGSGIGYCFSTLRPRGSYVHGAGSSTSGPLSFMDIYDKMCFTISSAGGRRGAQMGTFDVGHPDVFEFIRAKREDGRLRQFNLSLLITHEFMDAVKNDKDWKLSFPISDNEASDGGEINLNEVIFREWPITEGYIKNTDGLVACKVYNTVKARHLWDTIMSSTYDYSEPGFILIDRVNEFNNNWWCENINATNPCCAEGTYVATPQGYRKVETLAIGDPIITALGTVGYIERIEVHDSVPVYDVELTNGTVVCVTAAHIFHTKPDGSAVKEWDTNTRLNGLSKGVHVRISDLTGGSSSAEIKKITPAGIARVYDIYEPETDTWITDGGVVSRGCGEQCLPEYGSCLLGSINLTQFVEHPFTDKAEFNWGKYKNVASIFARMLDNVVEINGLPLERQKQEIFNKRRHGMGFLGLGSALTMLRIRYGSKESIKFTEMVSYYTAVANCEVSLALAIEKGPAPILDKMYTVTFDMLRKRPEMRIHGYSEGDMIRGSVLHAKYSMYMKKLAIVNENLIEQLEKVGARFTHGTSIAPTGTISLSLANNASNGIEPSFSHHYSRNVIREGKKSKEKIDVFSYELLAYRHLVNQNAIPDADCDENKLPDYFVTSDSVTPKEHIDIQAAAQKWIDSSISKTISVPSNISYQDFKDVYLYGYEKGLKGCTTFRFNPEVFQGVLVNDKDLESTTYQFKLEDGSIIEAKGNENIEYDGEIHSAANLFDAIKEGYYGKL